MTQQFFVFFVPGDIDLWPWNSNSSDIFVQCNWPPNLIVLRLVVRKLSCGQTDKHTDKQTDKQTDIAENIHRAPLCFAGE